MNIKVLGVDLGKHGCHLVGHDTHGNQILRKQLSNKKMTLFLANLQFQRGQRTIVSNIRENSTLTPIARPQLPGYVDPSMTGGVSSKLMDSILTFEGVLLDPVTLNGTSLYQIRMNYHRCVNCTIDDLPVIVDYYNENPPNWKGVIRVFNKREHEFRNIYQMIQEK